MEHTTSPFSRRSRRAVYITLAHGAFAMIASVAFAAPKAGAEAAATAPSAHSTSAPKTDTAKADAAEEKPASDDAKSTAASKKAGKTSAKARPKAAAKTAEAPPATPASEAAPTTEPAAPAITPRLVLPTASASAAPRDCNLLTQEAPRGGQLEVQGPKFGASPVVRVGNQVTRILRRERDKISVQIPADSNGGAVTVQVAGQKQDCGSLTIIGKNRD